MSQQVPAAAQVNAPADLPAEPSSAPSASRASTLDIDFFFERPSPTNPGQRTVCRLCRYDHLIFFFALALKLRSVTAGPAIPTALLLPPLSTSSLPRPLGRYYETILDRPATVRRIGRRLSRWAPCGSIFYLLSRLLRRLRMMMMMMMRIGAHPFVLDSTATAPRVCSILFYFFLADSLDRFKI